LLAGAATTGAAGCTTGDQSDNSPVQSQHQSGGDGIDVPSVHTDQLTVRFDPESDDLQSVVDEAPPGALVMGHTQAAYTVESPSLEIDTEGLTLRNVKIRAADDFNPPGGRTPVVRVTADDVTLANVEVDGNRSQQNNAFTNVLAWNVTGFRAIELETHSCLRHALDVQNPDFEWEENRFDDFYLSGVEAYNYGDDGITVHFVDGGWITNFYVHDANNHTGGSAGVEVESGSRNVLVSHGRCVNTGISGTSVESGKGQACQNVRISHVLTGGNRDGFAFPPLESETERGSSGHLLAHCRAENLEQYGLYVSHADVDVQNCQFVDCGGDSSGRAIRIFEGYGTEGGGLYSPTVDLTDCHVAGGRVEYTDTASGRISGVAAEDASIGVRSIDSTTLRIESLDLGSDVEAVEAAGESTQLVTGSRIRGALDVSGSATARLWNAEFVDGIRTIAGDGTVILGGYRGPIDLTGSGYDGTFTPELGASAFHDGTGGDGNPTGPTFGDGSDWVSLVDGSVID
jgi:hypothetical protein